MSAKVATATADSVPGTKKLQPKDEEAARRIRALPDWASKPILAMTANACDEGRRACQDAGMNDFIVIPIDPNVLYRVLLKWLPENGVPTSATNTQAPRDSTPSDCRCLVASVAGLDVARGLNLMRGSAGLYLCVLGLFLDSHGEDATYLRTALEL